MLYKAPIVLNPGVMSLARFIIISAETSSDVPVTFPPGSSRLSTRPAPTGSVIAAKIIGISVVSLKAACAAGVAMAMITSHSSPTKVCAIFFIVVISF